MKISLFSINEHRVRMFFVYLQKIVDIMPANKNAVTRYKYLDDLLSDRHHYYDIHDLVAIFLGTFPLKAFFTDGVKTSSGEEVSVKEIHRILREVTDAEDHSNPLTDEQLADMLAARGFKVARRTVAKYREQIGIPVARMRKS